MFYLQRMTPEELVADFPPKSITIPFVRAALHHRGYVTLRQNGRVVDRFEQFNFDGAAPPGFFDPRLETIPELTPRGRALQAKIKAGDAPQKTPPDRYVLKAQNYRLIRPIVRRLLR